MTANLPTIPADVLLWTDLLPGGAHWSGIIRYGTTLRFTDLTGGAKELLGFLHGIRFHTTR